MALPMSESTTPRLAQLHKLLAAGPDDAFLLYALALEHRKLQNLVQAMEFLDRTLQVDPNYCYAYYQKGQVYESQGDQESARQSYRQGIDAAVRVGDAKARGELEAALSAIE
jgi:Flp pilus assembly protein TadD